MVIKKQSELLKCRLPGKRSREELSFLARWIIYSGLGLIINSCVVRTPTTTPLPSSTKVFPSATFAYPTIPPTATRIPEPSLTPTPDASIGLGEVIFEDDFSTDRGWEFSEQELGAISLLNNRLVIAIRQSESFLFSLFPDLILDDFFLEVEVRADLCQPGDEFGVMFRANERFEHYRFSLNCEGESRVVRILSGDSRSLVPLSEFPYIRSGPMSSNRMSLKAIGDGFQFWINGFDVYTSRDIALSEGAIGLFVRSGRGNQATISFDNLLLRELLPTPTASVTQKP